MTTIHQTSSACATNQWTDDDQSCRFALLDNNTDDALSAASTREGVCEPLSRRVAQDEPFIDNEFTRSSQVIQAVPRVIALDMDTTVVGPDLEFYRTHDYAVKHNLSKILGEAVESATEEQASNPYKFIAEFLLMRSECIEQQTSETTHTSNAERQHGWWLDPSVEMTAEEVDDLMCSLDGYGNVC